MPRIDCDVRGNPGTQVESRRFPNGFTLGMLATRLQELSGREPFDDTGREKEQIEKLTCYVDGLISENSPLVKQARTKTVQRGSVGQSVEEVMK